MSGVKIQGGKRLFADIFAKLYFDRANNFKEDPIHGWQSAEY